MDEDKRKRKEKEAYCEKMEKGKCRVRELEVKKMRGEESEGD